MKILGKKLSKFSKHELIDLYLYYKGLYESTKIQDFHKTSVDIMEYLNSLKNTNENMDENKYDFTIDDLDIKYLKINSFNGCYSHSEYQNKCYDCLYNRYSQMMKVFNLATDYLLEIVQIDDFDKMLFWLEILTDNPEHIATLAREIRNKFLEEGF